MEILIRIHDNNILVAEIEGEVDAYTSQELEKILSDSLAQGYNRIVIDISKMAFISSAGIRVILYTHREAVQTGGEVRLVSPADQVKRTLQTVGMFEILQISKGLQESIVDW